jgi:crotonobetainyl-CoA:carnitine CoA-transferase CaiB-like acyl-CoA transferase
MAPIPAVGEHTDTILRELGYEEETLAALRREGAI